MERLTISPDHPSSSSRRYRARKGRIFSGSLLGYIRSLDLCPQDTMGDLVRPILLMTAASIGQDRPFHANLSLGEVADSSSDTPNAPSSPTFLGRVQTLKSLKYSRIRQVCSTGVVVTSYLPYVFDIDPGMVDPDKISFCVAPPVDWLEGLYRATNLHDLIEPSRGYVQRKWLVSIPYERMRIIVGTAPMVSMFLDHRSKAPILKDLWFQVLLFLNLLGEGQARIATGGNRYWNDSKWGESPRFVCHHPEAMKISCAVQMIGTHETFEDTLGKTLAEFRSFNG